MIYVLWNVWNEVDRLNNAVDSIELCLGENTVRHLFCDGKYPTHSGNSEISDDGTGEIIARRKFDAMEFAGPEVAKLNMLLRIAEMWAEPGDWLLHWDADEVMTRGWSSQFLIDTDIDVGGVSFSRSSDDREYVRNRLWRWEYGLNYQKRHQYLFDREGELFTNLTETPRKFGVVGTGVHLDAPREPEREEAERDYYRWLVDHEENAI